MKAGFRSNNLDPNARHCMASAAVGFMRTFGIDEPMGCYDDIEAADAFVLWGSNMAEMHPILWTRVDRSPAVRAACRASPCCRPSSTARSTSPTSAWCSSRRPTSIMLNAIANHIVKTGRVNKDFVDKHTAVQARPDRHRLRPASRNIRWSRRRPDAPRPATPPTSATTNTSSSCPTTRWRRRPRCRACRSTSSRRWPSSTPIPKIKVTSFWTMGFNQHTRGVWCNNLVYNIHLLTGKISEPGNSPFSLTGQPSACGTAREVGTFSHRLPADMVVTNKAHRDIAEKIWKLPEGTIPDKPGYHAVLQNRMLKDGLLNAYWVQVNNNLQAGANANEETCLGYRNPDNFIVVSDAYPSVTALAADLILPTAMWVEKEGAYGNAERRTHVWHQLVSRAGRVAIRISGS